MLAAMLIKSSGTQINCALDPSDGNVTIETLQRAAALVGRRVQLELV
jgi:antitoxin HicB